MDEDDRSDISHFFFLIGAPPLLLNCSSPWVHLLCLLFLLSTRPRITALKGRSFKSWVKNFIFSLLVSLSIKSLANIFVPIPLSWYSTYSLLDCNSGRREARGIDLTIIGGSLALGLLVCLVGADIEASTFTSTWIFYACLRPFARTYSE